MTKKVAWSYSALNAYETCPRRFYLTRVAKKVIEPQTEALTWGNKVHKALEEYAKGKKALPEELEYASRYVDKILKLKGKRIIEGRMAINKYFKPCKWMANDVWCRGVIDIGVVGSKKAVVMDWKTGKRRPDSDQLELFAGMVFAHYPYIEEVKTGFIWLNSREIDTDEFHRDDRDQIWSNFLPRVKRMQRSHDEDKWMPNPSGLCKNWCPVGNKLCEYCGV